MKAHCYPAIILIAIVAGSIPLTAKAKTIVLDLEVTPPAGKLSVTQIPKKPATFVIDEPAMLSFPQKAELESLLSKANDVPIYVVLKKGKLPVTASLYGNELLSRWTGSGNGYSAMILLTNSSIPELFIIIAGRRIDAPTRNDLLQLGNAARSLIKESPAQFSEITRLTEGLSGALNTFAQISGNSASAPVKISESQKHETTIYSVPVTGTSQPPQTNRGKTSQWDLLSSRLDWPLIQKLVIYLGAVILPLIGILVLRRIRRHRPLFFPIHEPRQRFNAPYSGGSNAQIKYVED